MDYAYIWHNEVREYEIDFQGIVNHSVYINYLEQCRCLYLRTKKFDVCELHTQGYDLVLADMETQYKVSLRSADEFYVTLNTHREGKLRICFEQKIFKSKTHELVLVAKVTVVCLDAKTRKPCAPEFLTKIL